MMRTRSPSCSRRSAHPCRGTTAALMATATPARPATPKVASRSGMQVPCAIGRCSSLTKMLKLLPANVIGAPAAASGRQKRWRDGRARGLPFRVPTAVGSLRRVRGRPVFPTAVRNASGSKASGTEHAPISARSPGLAQTGSPKIRPIQVSFATSKREAL